MLVEFSVIPLGTGQSVGEKISEVLRIVDTSGLPYKVNPMGTVVEGEWDELFAVIKRCHESGMRDSGRVITTITIDDRSGAGERIEEKVRSVEKRLGKSLKK